MMKVVKYILLLLFSIEFCGIAMGGSYITKSSTSPGYKFEESTSWNNNSMPGSYNSTTKKFSAIGNSDIEVNGYVGLSGSLDIGNDVFLSGSQLTIKKNSIFVIDGDLIISDRVDVVIEEGATLYITGNLITENKSDIWSYVQMDIKKNANIVVEGNVTSTNDANVAVNFENGNNSDFYVFGSISGDVYRQIGSTIVGTPKYKSDGTSKIDNEQQYNKDETALNNTVENIITEVINGCKTINVPAGKTVKISTPTEPICNIVMGDNRSQLIIESSSVLNLSQDVTISKGIVTNYGKIISENDLIVLPHEENGQKNYFYNNGSIKVKNYYLGTNSVMANSTCFNFSCGSSIEASEAINFVILGWTGNLELLGDYKAKKMVVDYQSGGNAVNFGKDCGDSKVELKELVLKNNISTVNINEITGLEKLELNTYSSVKMSVDGVLTIGNVVSNNGQTLGITGTSESIIKLCYNPTHNLSGDFNGNGQTSSTSGTLYYRYDENDLDHSWFKEGESIPILKPANSPVKENDVACNGCTMQANNVSLEECMNGTLKLLGIEDDPFIPKNKELHFLYDSNPCSKEFETSKVRIRELSNKWFRSINGQLYYCEGDNE
ncbi:MAG: hypothetical protein MJ204_03320 [Bacteroidales bacterium]|nr:hypothetical protein [Bacteroidales bacterium]